MIKTFKSLIMAKAYRVSTTVNSTLPSGIYSGCLKDVSFDSTSKRVHLHFEILNPLGVITRSMDAVTRGNSRLLEFSQSLLSPNPIPRDITLDPLLDLLRGLEGRFYTLAYTAYTRPYAVGALSVVPSTPLMLNDCSVGLQMRLGA
jgi:hypothetical protein